jgi:penicillin amidase
MPVNTVSERRRSRRWVVVPLILTLTAALLAAGAAWWVAEGTVPQQSGELQVKGLEAPVEVLFDSWGIPHIYARDSADAWFAVGFLQARERLWKLELYRRVAAGRLSELFGERTLQADRRFRALALRRAAAAELGAAPTRTKLALDRYAAGVNAALGTLGRWKRPLEFQLLGITPEPWTPLDSLAVAKLMAWRLAENRHGELVRGVLTRQFGEGSTERLMGMWPPDAPTIIQRSETHAGRSIRSIPPTFAPVRTAAYGLAPRTRSEDLPPGLEWLSPAARPGGSNGWVVAGSRTASGRPLLANDPHLGLEMPSLWYEAHLVAADLDVAGAMLPGSPFVVIGHNDRIAWGITNSGVDVQDFYIEDVDFGRRRYLYGGTWQPLKVDRAEIDVRGLDRPYIAETLSTRHGPLIATENDWEDLPTFSETTRRGSPRPLALRWDSISGESAGPFEALNRARSWQEFLSAVRRVAAPSLSFIYADSAGTIGYAMSGALPVRAQGDGSIPTPGWTAVYEWIGTVPAERLPAAVNPPSAQFVTANAEVDPRWPGTMTRDWTAPFRTTRIIELLGNRTGLQLAGFREMQADVRSLAADRMLETVEAAVRSGAAEKADPEARTALERLRLWDRRVDQRPVVSLYEAFERAMWRRTFADEMQEDVFKQFLEYGLGERFVGLYAILHDPGARWWDDIATVDRRESRDDIVILAAADALMTLRNRFGDEARWSWGRLHAAHFRHPLGSGPFPLRWLFDRGPVSVGGDSSTLNKAAVDRRQPYAVEDIASYRQIVDVGAWDSMRAVNPTGQSGHPRSPHYFDQNALWAAAKDRPFPFSRVEVEKAKASRLLLVP